MAKPDTGWYDRAKNAQKLSVFSSLSKGLWGPLFPRVITDFNAFSTQLKLGVSLTTATAAPDEAENSFGGADILFVAGDKFEFKASGQKDQVTIGPLEQGHTRTLAWDFGKGAQNRKACILMRANPTTGGRTIGNPCLIAFAIHEVVHALGLVEHTPNGGDLFEATPQLRAGAKNKPDDDKFEVNGGKTIPPLFLLGTTIARIQKLWPTPIP